MSVDQFEQGSILAFEFLANTVAKQPPDTIVLPAWPTKAVLLLAAYEMPALCDWMSS